MMNQRMIQSRFCATLSAGALALVLASPALAADPAGQAEIQLAKNHMNSLKKPSPALSGKALKAFKKSEKAFQARAKQKPRKPTGKKMMDSCNKSKECREQLKFIEKEMKKKKSGSLDFGLPDLASALNPFQIKEAQASHLSTLYFPTNRLRHAISSGWNGLVGFGNVQVVGDNLFWLHVTTDTKAPFTRLSFSVPYSGFYLFGFRFLTGGMEFEYGLQGGRFTNHSIKGFYDYQVFYKWHYLSAGQHSIKMNLKSGAYQYSYILLYPYPVHD